MGLRDIVHKIPAKKEELSDYITDNYDHVKGLIEVNPQYKSVLEDAISRSFDKYSKYLGSYAGKTGGLGRLVGYTADAWFLSTGDIIGALGGKFINLLAQIPEKTYALYYGVRTGNYLDAMQNLLEGAVSYLPGLTVVDHGLERIIKKRMVKDAVKDFEKKVGVYEPWTKKLYTKLSKVYNGVRDRTENVFRPDYDPAPQPA